MYNLISNELTKIFKSIWSLLPFLLITIIILVIGFFGYKDSHSNWVNELKKENVENTKVIASFKDIDEKEMMDSQEIIKDIETRIAINQYYIDKNIAPNGRNVAIGMLDRTTVMLTLIQFIIVVYASNMMSKEYGWGTIKFLMIRPYNRMQILLAKYVGLVALALIYYLFLITLSYIVGLVITGFNLQDGVTVNLVNGKFVEIGMFSKLVFKYITDFYTLILYSSIAFMLSTITRSNGVAIGVTLFISASTSILSVIISKYEWAKYLFFTQDFDNYYTQGIILDKNLVFSVMVIMVYILLFVGITSITFKKRDLV